MEIIQGFFDTNYYNYNNVSENKYNNIIVFKLSKDNLKNKIFSEVKHDDNDFGLLDFIEFESELIYNKILNNINCGIFFIHK